MNNDKKQKFKISYLIVALVVALLVCLIFVNFGSNGELISADTVIEYIENNNSVTADGSQKARYIYIKGSKGYVLSYDSNYEIDDMPTYSDYYFQLDSNGIIMERIIEACESINNSSIVSYTYAAAGVSFWDIALPILYIIFAIFIVWMIYRSLSSVNRGSMNFGKTKIKTYVLSKVKFDDIAGMDEEKAELKEVVEFLRNPKKFTDLGARIPRGVLLVGKPGTGKTLLARAVAGESKVPFISISGSDFVEMFVGVGASRVRDLFEQAKANKPCIVFIDEIDAVGRQRGTGLSNDEREQTLNQLLVEMDGFEVNDGVIVMAATNRSDILDPALLRPGRFDRQIYVRQPDVRGREGILRIHAKNKPIDDSVDLSVIARITSGFTGADLENMLNEAAILAARNGRPRIIMEDITEGINKVVMGPQKKSLVVTDKERKLTAYHESGHALLCKLLKGNDDVQEVSIIPRGSAGGYTMSRPEKDDSYITTEQANDRIAMCMGGRIAEELILNEISSGAYSDIKQASEIAHAMVYDWGMSEKIGFYSLSSQVDPRFGEVKNNFSDKLSAIADQEILDILNANYARGKKTIEDNIGYLHEMAKLLLERETIYKDEIDMIFEGKKTEEIIEIMNKKDEERRAKEQKIRDEKSQYEELKALENKLHDAETLYKSGILSEQEYAKVKEHYTSYKAELEADDAAKEDENHAVVGEVIDDETSDNSLDDEETSENDEATETTENSDTEKKKNSESGDDTSNNTDETDNDNKSEDK